MNTNVTLSLKRSIRLKLQMILLITECRNANASCEQCVRHAECLWCPTRAVACVPYPVGQLIPHKDFCDLSDARWGVCWCKSQMGCMYKKNTYVRTLFIDFSSAFNTLKPDIIITILKSLHVSPILCKFILDFLINRKQRVRINDIISDILIIQVDPKVVYYLLYYS